MDGKKFIIPFEELTIKDVAEVGGKNASLGEMIGSLLKKGIKIPTGYAVTATAYKFFLAQTGLGKYIEEELQNLKSGDLDKLSEVSKKIREKFMATPFPKEIENNIRDVHKVYEEKYSGKATFACRSSATAEDLPTASFAGEHETYLNVKGIEEILIAVKKAMASLFTPRAINYRIEKGFKHLSVFLSVGVQKMVRSDLACSGVMFTLDPESGFGKVVVISGSWGLGEMVVQGKVTPDEYIVFKNTLGQNKLKSLLKYFWKKEFEPIIKKKLGTKLSKMIYANPGTKVLETTNEERNKFVLTNQEILTLAKWGTIVERHYSEKNNRWTPMDLEWAKDGSDGELYIVQARPETIHSQRDFSKVKEYVKKESGKKLLSGASVGSKIATGVVNVINNPKEINKFVKGQILVTTITDPDWGPIMKLASAIVTDKGGRTSHAAIVARELGIPAVVGTGNATTVLKTGESITVDTTGSEGIVYAGILDFEVLEHDINKIPKPKTKILINIASPEIAFEKSFLPNQGVGLAREEFIIESEIGIHPMALINYEKLDQKLKAKIDEKTAGYTDRIKFYVDTLAFGIAQIAAAFYPNPVILRFSDFKTNEYRGMLGGNAYEPVEENPMLGWRGASRYYDPDFLPAFKMEVAAVKKVRHEMGLNNLEVMIPFCRTPEEGEKVIKVIENCGLTREKGLKIYVMCEIPSNVILADKFLDVFDGMSIGSNDLSQLILGIDRDGSEKVRQISNENNEAVKEFIRHVVEVCKKRGKYIGICGQAPSDYPEFARFLVKCGIDSISLNPDTLIKTTIEIAKAENE
ncbi:MAG: phosphoenolpyruvate synthase, pyruvate, water dikinase [Candidatus Levybacteria bacterium]|nr:phosphoenolpyruvate synthase, pyruvate, water dikinase [Candidatus Levybacteria bacterium]